VFLDSKRAVSNGLVCAGTSGTCEVLLAEGFLDSEDGDPGVCSCKDEEAADVSVPPLRVVPVVLLVLVVPVLLVIVGACFATSADLGGGFTLSASVGGIEGLAFSNICLVPLMVLSGSPLSKEIVDCFSALVTVSASDVEVMSSSVTRSIILTDDGAVGLGDIVSVWGKAIGVADAFCSVDVLGDAGLDAIAAGKDGCGSG
jgi:hypothetical protein